MAEQELRQRRDDLFDQFDAVGSAAEQLDLQLAIAAEIQLAEAAIEVDRDCPEFDHRQLMRKLGDAIAWRSLHPYTIRQLHHGAGAPPSISKQAGFQQTVEAAEAVTERGIPVVICDLTYCLGTGDVVAVIDPELPMLIECGNPRYTKSARKVRQTLRAEAALEQLKTGVAQWPGRAQPTVTVEAHTPSEHVYEALERAIRSALETGVAVGIPNPDQAVFALRDDGDFDTGVASVMDLVGPLVGECAVGFTLLHERLPSPRIAPPHVWPIAADCRRAVIEGEVIVGHMVRVAAFDGPSRGSARLLGAEPRNDGIYIKAENAVEACGIMPGLFDQLLGNHETVLSSIGLMLETVDAADLDRRERRLPDGAVPEPSSGELGGVASGFLNQLIGRAEELAGVPVEEIEEGSKPRPE